MAGRRPAQIRSLSQSPDPIMSNSRQHAKAPHWGALLCLVLPLVIYLHSLANGFSFDDDSVIVENTLIRSWGNLPMLFSRSYFANAGELSYRPLVTLSFLIDRHAWGLVPSGYHLVNMVLHGLNAIAVASVAAAWGASAPVGVMAGLLFGAHALASEVVCAAAFREDALTSLFMLLTVRLYLTQDRPSGLRVLGRVACYALALASKEVALVTLPMVVWCRWTERRRRETPTRVTWGEVAVQCAITLGYLLVRFKLMRSPMDIPEGAPRTVGVLAWDGLRILGAYVGMALFPFGLCSNCMPSSYGAAAALVGGLAVAVGVVWCAARRSGPVRNGLFWFALTFLPVSNVVRLRNPVAERHVYTPLLGFVVCLAGVFGGLWPRQRRRACVLLIVALACYGATAVQRVFCWQDDYALSTADIPNTPSGPRARHLLGLAYYKRGMLARSIASHRRARRYWPHYIEAWLNGGAALLDADRPAEALEWLKRALGVPPSEVHDRRNYAWAWYNTSLAYERMGQWDRAVQACRSAIDRGYRAEESFVALARVQTKAGKPNAAKRTLLDAAQLYPGSGRIQAALGDTWRTLQQSAAAAAAYEKALRLGWDHWAACINLANTYLDLGRAQEAAELCRNLLELAPDVIVAYYGLGMALGQLGRTAEARKHMEIFLRHWQGDPQLSENARAALKRLGKSATH